MNPDIPLHIVVFFLFMALYGFSEIAAILLSKGRVNVRTKDWTLLAVSLPFFLSWVSSALEAVIRKSAYSPFCFIPGVALLITGSVIRMSAFFSLKAAFSTAVERTPGQKLVKTGIYASIRHPLYLATIILGFSAPLALAAPFSLAFSLLTIAGVLTRIRKEEAFLSRNLPGYAKYIRSTKRLIPGVF